MRGLVGMGTVVCIAGMDGDGDDLETSCGVRGGDGDKSSGDGR